MSIQGYIRVYVGIYKGIRGYIRVNYLKTIIYAWKYIII